MSTGSSNFERRVSEEMSTEVQGMLHFPFSFNLEYMRVDSCPSDQALSVV